MLELTPGALKDRSLFITWGGGGGGVGRFLGGIT